MKYIITIAATVIKDIEVYAKDSKEAVDKANKLFGEIDLNGNEDYHQEATCIREIK